MNLDANGITAGLLALTAALELAKSLVDQRKPPEDSKKPQG